MLSGVSFSDDASIFISLPTDVMERHVRTERAPLTSAPKPPPGSIPRCPNQMVQGLKTLGHQSLQRDLPQKLPPLKAEAKTVSPG